VAGITAKGEEYRSTQVQINPSEETMRFKPCHCALVSLVFSLTFTMLSECQDTSRGSGWHKLDATAFSVMAPPGWSFRQLAGADSYVGEFVGDGVVLRFDFGSHSNPLKDEKEPTYVVVRKDIAGHRARVVSPRKPGHGITGVYFPRTFGSNRLTMFAKDLNSKQQELVLKLFETTQFGRTMPPVIPPPPPPDAHAH
jgi:hypothetical protein